MITYYILIYFLCKVNCYTLVYHTENTHSAQYYDCIYYKRSSVQDNIENIKYCRQRNKSQSLERNFNESCHHNGRLWTFKALALHNISVSDLLKWSSSVEQTDQYARYLYNHSIVLENKYICNCTNPSSFGKFCEYEYYYGSISFNDAIQKQFQPIESTKITIGSQLHGNRPCYKTWTCNSGLLCLDWRHICDGKQQCMNGLDEDYCELLEFNECENDEYRCANGMCIPEEYWLDGDYDCMDWTDEMNTIVHSGPTCTDRPSFVCDEHLCPYNQWSCADGQCISETTNRHKGTRLGAEGFCKSTRDIQYMCEAIRRNSLRFWTIKGGYCLPYPLHYEKLGLQNTYKQKCSHFVLCALSNSLSFDCECKNTTECERAIRNSCTGTYIQYPPSNRIISPYVYMIYERDQDWTERIPVLLGLSGQVKCVGYQMKINGIQKSSISKSLSFYRYHIIENHICNLNEEIGSYRNYSGLHYDINCWNHSKICNSRCISEYRIRDGIRDCDPSEENVKINNSCKQIQRHRFQCSSSELTCLLPAVISNAGSVCSNKRNIFDDKDNIVRLQSFLCKKRSDPGCNYLQNYIRSSSDETINQTTISKDSIINNDHSNVIPFRFYCDSFFDTKSGYDESPIFCKKWICQIDQYQCLSGQCIPQHWICDNEWDCDDGSDEERILILDQFSEHNRKLLNLNEVKDRCSETYLSNRTSFSEICDLTIEYPCFRLNVDDPLNVTLNRPCINLTQIADGKIDCLSAIDERNRIQCSDHQMLGFRFQAYNNTCLSYSNLCADLYSQMFETDFTYNTLCFYRQKFYKNGSRSDCKDEDDVMCLDDRCIRHARCNGIAECSHGEDEYRCQKYYRLNSEYRYRKSMQRIFQLSLKNYPSLSNKLSFDFNETDFDFVNNTQNNSRLSDVNMTETSFDYQTVVYENRHQTNKSVYEIVRDQLPTAGITFKKDYLPYICNRGVAVKYYTGHTVCFCPPSFYGAQCEFFSDRITVITHVDLTNYHSISQQITIIKVLSTFLFENQVIDYYEFHVNPWLERENNYIKQTIYFLYSRAGKFREIKKKNRNGTGLYSVRFEAFELNLNGISRPIGVWQYPIHLDFLPSFRLSKILRFSNRPCLTNLCQNNGTCQQFLNSIDSSYFCFCSHGYYGTYCQFYNENCTNFCAPNSICKPNYRGIISGTNNPLCLCSYSTFGSQCYIKNNQCQEILCLHGGTCVVQYNPDKINAYICICTDLFQGNHCEYPKGIVFLNLTLIQTKTIVATTISFNDYHNRTSELNTRHQQVYSNLPSYLTLNYNQNNYIYAPTIAVMKLYENIDQVKYFILYYQLEQKDIEITVNLTSSNYCPLISNKRLTNRSYSNNFILNSTTAVFLYHHICQDNKHFNFTFSCFRDLNYLCLCESDSSHAECFGYNPSIDRCSFCLSNGHCLKGELNVKNDFVCLCPRCYYGNMCEYSTELMSFTLDSLIVKDIQNNQQLSSGILISIAILIFLFGLFNNLSSFLTFLRWKSRKFGVGNYLLIVSIVDQTSLLLLFLKIIHIILATNGTLFIYINLNRFSCKIISYLLSVLTRLTYWLTSFVTIERLCIVLFPTSTTLKNPCLALSLTSLTVLIVCAMHVHEIFYYMIIDNHSYTSMNVTLCVSNYQQSFLRIYNRINILFHYFVPFLVQMIAITIMIIQTAISRARANSNRKEGLASLFKKQLKTQKELYVLPLIIVLSSLPQTILSFSYACDELNQPWQRRTLLAAYFFSYLPQMLGFILYVLPSTVFFEEFRQTIIGKRFLRQQQQADKRKK